MNVDLKAVNMHELALSKLNEKEILILSNNRHRFSFYNTMTNTWSPELQGLGK